MLFLVDQVAVFSELTGDYLTGGEAFQSLIVRSSQIIEGSVRVEDFQHGKIVPLGDFKVEPVMCRSNFQYASTEILFHRFIGNNRHSLRVDWTHHMFAL